MLQQQLAVRLQDSVKGLAVFVTPPDRYILAPVHRLHYLPVCRAAISGTRMGNKFRSKPIPVMRY
jgi:hypothetical protein